MISRVLIVIVLITCIFLPNQAASENVADALQSFGLEGRWSFDCAEQMNPRTNIVFTHTYLFSIENPSELSIVFQAGGLREVWKIDSAVRVTDEKIKLTRTRSERTFGENSLPSNEPPTEVLVFLKKDKKLQIRDRYSVDFSVIYVRDGFIYDLQPGNRTDQQIRWLEKCLN
jgi:hypothetical protein